MESAGYMSVDGRGAGTLDDLCAIFQKAAPWSKTIAVADYDPLAQDLPEFLTLCSMLLKQDIAVASGTPNEQRLYSQSEIKHALRTAGYDVVKEERLPSLQHFHHGAVIMQDLVERAQAIPDARLSDLYGARAQWLAQMAMGFDHIPAVSRHVTVAQRSN